MFGPEVWVWAHSRYLSIYDSSFIDAEDAIWFEESIQSV